MSLLRSSSWRIYERAAALGLAVLYAVGAAGHAMAPTLPRSKMPKAQDGLRLLYRNGGGVLGFGLCIPSRIVGALCQASNKVLNALALYSNPAHESGKIVARFQPTSTTAANPAKVKGACSRLSQTIRGGSAH